MKSTSLRLLWILGGMIALGLAVAGAVLPILPATPFAILAAFCFARGSARLNNWLLRHPWFGPGIANWQRHGAITRKAKRVAVAGMALTLLVSFLAGVSAAVIAIQALAMAGAATFILTRPSPPA